MRRELEATSLGSRNPRKQQPWRQRVLAGAACAALIFGWTAGQPVSAQEPDGKETRTYGEYAVKAAFLYNFAKFTHWPAAAGGAEAAPIRVCVLGRDPFGTALDSFEGRRIRGRAVETLRVSTLAKARSCQVLFISASAAGNLAAILEELRQVPVLTVTDLPRGAAAPSIVRLETVAKKVRFAIDAERAAAAGLSFSSKLLSLAGPRGGTAAAAPRREVGGAEPSG